MNRFHFVSYYRFACLIYCYQPSNRLSRVIVLTIDNCFIALDSSVAALLRNDKMWGVASQYLSIFFSLHLPLSASPCQHVCLLSSDITDPPTSISEHRMTGRSLITEFLICDRCWITIRTSLIIHNY